MSKFQISALQRVGRRRVRGIDSRPFYTLTVFVGWRRRETTDLDPWKGDHSKKLRFRP